MSEIERARASLDAKLASMGYSHPESGGTPQNAFSTGGLSPYKSLNQERLAENPSGEGGFAGTNEGGGYSTSTHTGPYATLMSLPKQESKDQVEHRPCPTCNTVPLSVCTCPLRDMLCPNGHYWWFDRNGVLRLNDPHEDSDLD